MCFSQLFIEGLLQKPPSSSDLLIGPRPCRHTPRLIVMHVVFRSLLKIFEYAAKQACKQHATVCTVDDSGKSHEDSNNTMFESKLLRKMSAFCNAGKRQLRLRYDRESTVERQLNRRRSTVERPTN